MRWNRRRTIKKEEGDGKFNRYVYWIFNLLWHGGIGSMLEDFAGCCSEFEGTEIPKRSAPRIEG
jgi:hypothetical protein